MIDQSIREFFIQNAEAVRQARRFEIDDRNAFIAKYPLSRVKELSIEEYCLGTNKSKDSLSYFMEFGKTGFGIGGGSSRKHGVYFSKKDGCYMHGAEPVADVDEFWPKFRNEFYQFLIQSGESDAALNLDDFPMLQGMSMVLTKYLSLYYPARYLTIGSQSALSALLDAFGGQYDDSKRCHQLNFILNAFLKNEIPELKDDDGTTLGNLAWQYYWRFLHKGKNGDEKGDGLGDEDVDETRYWIYSPGTNASKWNAFSKEGVMGIGWEEMGDLSAFESRKAMQLRMKEIWGADRSYKMDSLATWQFVHDLKPGDIVYAKKGMYKIVGRGVVTSEYYYEDDVPEGEYRNYRRINWTNIGEWPHPGQAVMKTLTDITSYTEYVQKLEALFSDKEEDPEANEETERTWPPYSKERFLEEVYMGEEAYNTLIELIRIKKNVILQGAPGVGKTYAANRLAYSMLGEKNKDHVMMVQFHQSYSYEDFIEGFRPASDGNGFEIKKGSFYSFCKKAADDLENKYFFIIDEINRGNLSKIFGELFMLIESDKRGNALQLLYSDEKFSVPQNVYIIGMMNTADRSLAMLDYALRRRFAFFDMMPEFESEGFRTYRTGLASEKFNRLIACTERLNEDIARDESLGEGFCVGHSYFCNLTEATDSALREIVEYELAPLLKEYWYDNRTKAADWINRLKDAIR